MKNQIRFFFVPTAALACCLLAGCGMSAQQKADADTVHESGVSPVIYDKMIHEDDLSFGDIKGLCAARVSEGLIIRYIRDRETIYILTGSDVDELRRSGASDSLIDFLLQTAKDYQAANGPSSSLPVAIGLGIGFGPGPLHWHNPGYWDRW